jgi:hypothetical protein
MGKAALFAISAFVVMGSVYGVTTSTSLLATDERIADYQYATLARNVALAGYNQAIQGLADDFVSGELNGTYEDGDYTAEVVVNLLTQIAEVEVVGTVVDNTGQPVTHHIFATLKQKEINTGTTLTEAPVFMQYALITNDDLTLNGNVSIDTIKAVGWEGSAYNANVHTNGRLTVNGRVVVRGFGTYRTSKILNPNQPSRFFKPYDNGTGEPLVKQLVDGIEIPLAELDPATLNTQFPPDRVSGDVTLNGTQNFEVGGAGTRANPYIWYVNGDLTVNGNVNMIGYVIFLVEEDVILNGNVTISSNDPEAPSENKLGLYARGNITLNGTVDVLWGQILASGDFTMNGTPSVNGNIVVGGRATLNGTPNINYYPPSPALTRYWEEPVVEEALEQISYYERDNSYQPS